MKVMTVDNLFSILQYRKIDKMRNKSADKPKKGLRRCVNILTYSFNLSELDSILTIKTNSKATINRVSIESIKVLQHL